VAVPETHYTFEELKKAQALGDVEALKKKGLPVLAVHLGNRPLSGLQAFEKALTSYLKQSTPRL